MIPENANIISKNKKAYFEYEIIDTFNAGIILSGTEIKSVRANKVNIKEAYCYLKMGAPYIKGMHIATYDPGSYNNHEPLRDRKLLLNQTEIVKIEKKLKNKGLTVVPLALYITSKGLAKLEIGIAKGKKIYDKRESIKQKDVSREIDRKMKF